MSEIQFAYIISIGATRARIVENRSPMLRGGYAPTVEKEIDNARELVRALHAARGNWLALECSRLKVLPSIEG